MACFQVTLEKIKLNLLIMVFWVQYDLVPSNSAITSQPLQHPFALFAATRASVCFSILKASVQLWSLCAVPTVPFELFL